MIRKLFAIVAVAVLFAVCVPSHSLVASLSAQENTEQMASYYYQNREYDKAIELYEPLYQRTQNQFYYQMLYGCYVETQQYKEAERLVEKRMKRQQNDLTLYVDLGNLYAKRGDKKKSEKYYSSAVDRVGHDSRQVSDLAMSFENAGRSDYAIKTYLMAREKMNNQVIYVMELATLYGKSGAYDKMVDEYFNLLDKSPGSIGSIQIALQRALNETSGNALSEGLRQTLVSRIRQHPDNRSYLEMMIWFSLQQKDFDFALTQAKAVDARFPEQGGQQVMRVAQIAQNNEAYDIAEKAYSHIVAKG
ncbi:MAG: hypothetical protein II555_01710, partial [Bacteroidales bacterium]|nr:hypothetical protein [Bacteroidales bacterium]